MNQSPATRQPMPNAASAAAHLLQTGAVDAEPQMEPELQAMNQAIQADSIMLCSIHPMEKVSKLYTHGGRLKQYKIGAGSVAKPAYLRVLRTFQLIQSTTQVDPNVRPDQVPMDTSAQSIVKDLLQEWGGDHPASRAGGIGIFKCEGSVATAEELESARKSFEARNRAIVEQTDVAWADPRRRNNISLSEAREAANWLGDRDHIRHPWFTEIVQTEFRLCPACGSDVKSVAFICPACTTNIAVHMRDRSIQPESGSWPGVEQELVFLAKASAALAKAS